MNENNIPELEIKEQDTAEETAVNDEIKEETKDAEVTETADVEVSAEEKTDNEIEEAASEEETENSESDEEVKEEETENESEAEAKEDQEATDEAKEEKTAEEAAPKKKRLLQIPVIISACIVGAALIAYLVFVAFFLKAPEGVIWSTELEDATYYFEFKDDGSFNTYVGSVEINSTYSKGKDEDGSDTLSVDTNVANFYGGYPATYEITGSRLLGNQVMNYSYGEGYDFSVTQSSRKEYKLELPENFEADEELLGEWVFTYYGYEMYKVTFNNDGSIKLQFIQDGITYNGTYTIEDGQINFTYFVGQNVAAPLEYSIENDTLSFLGVKFVRPGSEATPDEAIEVPVE